jgi:hypothetical protein
MLQLFDILNLESLAYHKYRRGLNYPGVPVRHFTNWHEYKQWMLKQKQLNLRKINNDRILREAKEEDERSPV